MECVQTNTLGAAAHLFVGVGEAAHATECADDVAECTLGDLALDGRVIADDVGEDCSKADLSQNLVS